MTHDPGTTANVLRQGKSGAIPALTRSGKAVQRGAAEPECLPRHRSSLPRRGLRGGAPSLPGALALGARGLRREKGAPDAMYPRHVIVACAVTALLTAMFGAAAADTAPKTSDPAQAAAGWLAGQLVNGDHLESEFNGTKFPDPGLTADAVLAFDAAGVAQKFAKQATGWLAKPEILTGYVGDGTSESYAGAHGKLALVAIAQGLDPREFGGVNLIKDLQDLQAASGRYSDHSQYPDFSNAIGQSLAVIALLRAGENVTTGAAYLAGSQCDDGGFPLLFEKTPCVSEPDATGFAVQALLAAGLDEAAAKALDYLKAVQREGGGFGGPPGSPTEATNANSTALAAQALHAGGRAADDTAADDAVAYLKSLQVGCAGPAEQHGAVAYTTAGFESSSASRATAQAVPALSGTGLLEVDNTGDSLPAPVLACAPPSSSTTPAATTSPATTQPAATSPSPQGGSASELPATGSRVLPLLWAGALLVLAGAGLVLVARRRTPRPGAEQ